MDILIKNMDKPKSCDDCRFTEQGQGYLTCAITGNYAIDSTYKSCPLVALPLHGRLIDADAFKEASKDKSVKCAMVIADGTAIGCELIPMKEFYDWVDKAPSIVEASK